jgi:aminoglycoside phosphotransferase (APT) family kinase protein
MPRDLVAADSKLYEWLARKAGGEIVAARLTPLLHGAVLRHWRLDIELRGGRFAGVQNWVLRADGSTSLGLGLTRAREFALQRCLFRAGLKVAEPLFMCCDKAVIGAPFFVMGFVPGESDGAAIVGRGENENLAAALAAELAALHALDVASRLRFLPKPPADAAASRLAELRRLLAADDDPHPVAEWALRWLTGDKPAAARPVLCHGDFRTGNYLVDDGTLAGVLDWDFAAWSDPDEDIAWFCAKAWRFGANGLEAGGIASRAVFYRAYETAARRRIDAARIHYWEVMAALRWLVLALKQRDRFSKKGERSLDLALTGRRVAECEHEILVLTGLES